LPQEGAVRIEEMINYFSYEYAQPTGKDPFAVHTELADMPMEQRPPTRIDRVAGKKIDASDLPPSNLTFLIDVSGSMMSPDKLPLVKASLKLLVDQLRRKTMYPSLYMQAMRDWYCRQQKAITNRDQRSDRQAGSRRLNGGRRRHQTRLQCCKKKFQCAKETTA
jgi:hypothetical protein